MKKWRACRLLRMSSLSESCLDEQRYSSFCIIRAISTKSLEIRHAVFERLDGMSENRQDMPHCGARGKNTPRGFLPPVSVKSHRAGSAKILKTS
ncbi:MAG: hypothetical protein K6F46_06260, partial [Desulfovibrio sp.]|nr:hypothetical protein [Desulfovibrio sp.]